MINAGEAEEDLPAGFADAEPGARPRHLKSLSAEGGASPPSSRVLARGVENVRQLRMLAVDAAVGVVEEAELEGDLGASRGRLGAHRLDVREVRIDDQRPFEFQERLQALRETVDGDGNDAREHRIARARRHAVDGMHRGHPDFVGNDLLQGVEEARPR